VRTGLRCRVSWRQGRRREAGATVRRKPSGCGTRLAAIARRAFLVHEHVAIARQLLNPYRVHDEHGQPKSPFELQPGLTFQKTPILSDLRVIDMLELAMRHDIPEVKDRKGNWVQSFGPEDDARLFATAQFRRYQELAEKYLPKLQDANQIAALIQGGEA